MVNNVPVETQAWLCQKTTPPGPPMTGNYSFWMGLVRSHVQKNSETVVAVFWYFFFPLPQCGDVFPPDFFTPIPCPFSASFESPTTLCLKPPPILFYNSLSPRLSRRPASDINFFTSPAPINFCRSTAILFTTELQVLIFFFPEVVDVRAYSPSDE